MKKTIFAFVAGTILLASCGGGGVSEEFKKELTAFEADWKATDSIAKEFGKTLAAEDSAFAAIDMTIADSVKANATPEQIAKCDSIAGICGGHNAKLDSMKTEFDGFVAGWDNDGKAWGDFKAAVEKGEKKEEDAKKELEAWKTKITDAKAKVDGWKAALDGVKSECSATCEAHKTAVAEIAAAPVVEEKGKKKK